MRGERGSMTMFALLALTVLLLAALLFSDLLRASLAAAKAETEARRAARSMLAGFDKQLLEYGLFGAGADELRETHIRHGLEAARRKEAEQKGFSWYDVAQVTLAGVEPLYDLGDHRVFHSQLLERMKYIAPIEFGQEVLQSFSSGKEQIAGAKRTAEMTKELGEALQRREAALDRAWDAARRLAAAAGSETAGHTLNAELNALRRELAEAEEANREMSSLLKADGAKEIPAFVRIYPPDYFSVYEVGAAAIVSMHNTWREALQASQAEDVPEGGRSPEELRAELLEAASGWMASRSAMEAERAEAAAEARRSEGELKRKAERELENARDGLFGLCAQVSPLAYERLEGDGGLFEKYRRYNSHHASSGIEPDMDIRGAEAFLASSFSLLDLILQAAEGLRDEAYVNEYVLTHFTFKTWEREQAESFVPNAAAGNRPLSDQEAEYILYGLPSCRLNMSAMYAELFAFRTALRTLEALLSPGAAARAASPMAAILAALAEGAKKAGNDIRQLLDGKAVDLPFAKGIKMSYKDHLRLFYLLHSRNESVYSRMQALIELNTGADLTMRYTAMRVTAEAAAGGMLLKMPPVRKEVVVSY